MSDPGAQGSEGGEGTAVWGCAEWGLDRGQKLGGPAQELLLHQAACRPRWLHVMLGFPGRASLIKLLEPMVRTFSYFITV